jgi:phage-related protein
MKPVRFIRSAKEDISAFPKSARTRAGYELFMVQVGREPAAWKPLPQVGAGACEIRVREESRVYRVIYVAKFADAVYVLHAFQKRTQRTARADLELARQRYREALAMAKRSE